MLFIYIYIYSFIYIYFFRYDTTKDFAVVYQPFMKLFNAPNSDPRRAPPLDPNLVTYDCFHFSQRGHAVGNEILLLVNYFG